MFPTDFTIQFSLHGLTLPQRSTTMPAPAGAPRRLAPSPDKPRHMDVYPSRNVDIRKHRMPATHNNKLNACGDRERSAGAFLD
jgi:hypothetical protein